MTWSDGYLASIDYNANYFPELSPLSTELLLLSAGIRPPSVGVACELGYGMGLSVNIHAAGTPTRWWGTDFLPAQAAFAQELAAASGSGTRLFDEAFEDFCHRSDLPDFDFIGLHGIWSWVSDASRQVIVDFLRRKLKPGGVVYLGYNTPAGWAALAPVRELMAVHAARCAPPGQDPLAKVDAALAFVEQLLAAEPQYLRHHPLLAERVKKLRGENRTYLAHEYFNANWHLADFALMGAALEPARLAYACSARPLEQVDALHLTPAQSALLRGVADPMLREMTRDLLVNQVYRADLWVKGARRLAPAEQSAALRRQRVVLIRPAVDVVLLVKGRLGELPLQEAVCRPVLDLLADHQPRSLGEIEDGLKARGGPGIAALLKVVLMLLGKGDLACAQPEAAAEAAAGTSRRLNQHLLERSRFADDVFHLVSPVTGGGVPVGRYAMLFLLALSRGMASPAEWGQLAWSVLAPAGTMPKKEGAPQPTPEQAQAELLRQARAFEQKGLPLMRALRVI